MSSKPRFVGKRVKLGDVLQVVNGKNQKAVKDENGQYPIYGSGGQMGWASSYICPADTVIIGRKGNINKPIYVSEPFWNVDTAFGLVAKPELLDARYLYHFCKHYDFGKLNTTCTIPSLTRKNIEGILLRLPSLGGQKETAAQLDSILKQIALAQQEIAGLDSLVKSRFVEMFGNICEGMSCFDMTPINDLCTRIVGGGTPSMKHPEYYEDGTIPWLKSGDVKARVVGSGVLDITEAGLANSSARMVPEGSIIVVTRSGILKHSLPVAKAACPIAINQDLKALIPGDRILPDYLQWSLIVASPLLLSKVRATTADNIETSFLKSFKVPVPPVSLQREFVAFVAQVDKSRFIAQQQIEKLQRLYDSLAQDYFGD